MADIIVQTLKVEDEASAALGSAASASDDLAAAEQRQLEAAHGLTEAEKKLLAQMKSAQTILEQRAKAAGLSVTEMRALEQATLRQAAAEQKQAAAAAAAAEEVAEAARAQAGGLDESTEALDETEKASKRAAFGAKNLRFQLADIGTTLVGGMNPFVVLAQQGPDLWHAFEAGGGAMNTLKATFGGLIAQAAVLGPILLGVGAAAGVIAVAYTETAMAAEDARGLTGTLNDALAEQEGIAGTLANTITNTGASWLKFTQDAAETALAIERINTGMINVGAAIAGAEAQIQGSGGKALLATSQRIAELQRLVSAENERQASGLLNFSETEKSIKQEGRYKEEIARLLPVMDQKRAAYDAAKEDAAALAEYNAELSNSEGVLAERQKKTAAATKAKAEADKIAAEWTRQAKEVNDAYYAAIQRNIDAIRAGEEAFYAQSSASARLNASLAPLIDRTNELAPPEAIDRVTQLTLLLMELETRAAGSAEANAALADEIERVGSALAVEQANTRIKSSAQTFGKPDLSGIAGSIGGGFDAISGSGGDVFAMLGGGANALGGLMGAAGVAGAAAAVAPVAAVAAALGALVKLTDAIVVTGQERGKGERSIIEQGTEFLNDFFIQFAELPTALAEQLGALDFGAFAENFSAAIEGFLVGLVEAAPTLIVALIESLLMQSTVIQNAIIGAIPEVIAAVVEVFGDPQTWIDMAKAIVEAVKETLKTSLDVRREARDANAAFVGGALQTASGRIRGLGGGMNITINGMVGDSREIIRTLRDNLGSLGGGLNFDRDSRWGR